MPRSVVKSCQQRQRYFSTLNVISSLLYLSAIETGSSAGAAIGSWVDYYDRRHPQFGLRMQDPEDARERAELTGQLAAQNPTRSAFADATKLSHQAAPTKST